MIAVQNLNLLQGNFALSSVSFTIPTGKCGVLMGKTGCGKTSILEAIAGLRPITSGEIILGGRGVSREAASRRNIGYVPQDAALFPTMTIRDHLAFALEIRRAPESTIEERVAQLSEWLGIAHLLKRKPAGLSGGEAQRVAIGRALSFRPGYLLLDEPLSSLDESTRAQLVELLKSIRQRANATILYVTHSRAEAEQLADVLFVLDKGKIVDEEIRM